MLNLKSNIERGRHVDVILMTYILLGVAFLFMLALNVYAYFNVTKMSGMYTSLNSAAVNAKLKTTSANLLFREIMSGYSDKEIGAVWELLKEAKKSASKLSEIGESVETEAKLNAFKDMMTKIHTGTVVDEKKKVQEDYDSAFSDVIDHVGKVEEKLNDLIEVKILTVRILYCVLLISMVALFALVVSVMKKYIVGRQVAEKDLQDARDSLKTILNSIDSIIISTDSQEQISRWNLAAEKYFGVSSDKVMGGNLWETLPFLKKFHVEYEKVFQLQKPAEFPKEKLVVGEQERYINLKMNYAKGIDGVVIMFDDVTSHEVQDRQMRQAQKMQIVENLIGGLAHGFNNALGAITGTITMLKYSLEHNSGNLDEIRSNMDVIESSAERAVVMVQQILTLSQKHEVSLSPSDLNAAVQHVMKICENTIDKRVELVGEIFDARAVANADPALIEQVLLNLCDNAVQAMTIMRSEGEAQGGTLTVSMDRIYPDKNFRTLHPQAAHPSYWIISVSDTGVGMEPETIAKMFDPFFTTKEKFQASGLGLMIAGDIVRQHNGFIEVASKPGAGTKVSVFIPEIAGYAAEAGGAQPPAVEKEQIPTGTGLILVADDELIMRKTAKSILNKLGYEVIFAEDGAQTVDVFREKHSEVKAVLLDMMMPKMSGRDAYVEMKKIDPGLKVLLISGFKRDSRIDEALKLGVNGFIQKPYSMITLAKEMKKVITS